MSNDPFHARKTLKTTHEDLQYYDITALTSTKQLQKLPYCIRILLENLLRNCDNFHINPKDVEHLAHWNPQEKNPPEIAFKPARVILQDFTGVPAIVDLAAMRDAMKKLGGDPQKINPLIPADLVIDHSVQVDHYAKPQALQLNSAKEFERNKERYEFLRWGSKAFDNFRVVPPATGIVHQVNLEYLGQVVQTSHHQGYQLAYPDTLIGTDSHTTMINALGILGWGVGGIEAEAALLGQPVYILTPQVVGMKLVGKLKEGVTATDLVLNITKTLRQHGVVGKFVEFYGPGIQNLSLADRATIANMAPEYGATMGFFPIDQETIHYLETTARPPELIERVDSYAKAQLLFNSADQPDPLYTDHIEFDMDQVYTSLAGPKRPQDRITLDNMQKTFQNHLTATTKQGGFEVPENKINQEIPLTIQKDDQKKQTSLSHGSLVIAAITSCTNTSNPSVMVAAGIIAQKALDAGLKPPPHVKTSLAPGSKVVRQYLEEAKLLEPLEKLGFHIVGYGCTSCIGNSGPLLPEIKTKIKEHELVVASVLSGNRNFEGRVSPLTKANYLASPPLVVAYALAGTVNIDLRQDPLGYDKQQNPVFLKDLWPTNAEIQATIHRSLKPEMFAKQYAQVFEGDEKWQKIATPEGDMYNWPHSSTYIKCPPFFDHIKKETPSIKTIKEARVLAKVGHSITTDHISPAGGIAKNSPAASYLLSQGVDTKDFNSYGARRGNHEVMMRGTFANVRFKNELAPNREGGYTMHFPTSELTTIFEASRRYRQKNTPLIILAGQDYGMGSSRDWAAKGVALLGVQAVIFETIERIHRSNLIGMGVLPLQFLPDQNPQNLGLTGQETFTIELNDQLQPLQELTVQATHQGKTNKFQCLCRLDSPVEVEYYRHGGILHYVLRNLSK